MKKFITVCLMLALLVSMSVSVFAENGGFLVSISRNQAPVLVGAENESDDCVAQLLITAYADRAELPDEIRTKLEEAYKIIVENPDLSALNAELKETAEALGVNVTDFAVSDMFDISLTDCNGHEDHGHFDITLKPEFLENFVCLLHYYNGEWRVVKDAKVTGNGEHLEFTEDEFSPFAIVVNTAEDTPDSPTTFDVSTVFAVVAVLSASAIVVLAFAYKKRRA